MSNISSNSSSNSSSSSSFLEQKDAKKSSNQSLYDLFSSFGTKRMIDDENTNRAVNIAGDILFKSGVPADMVGTFKKNIRQKFNLQQQQQQQQQSGSSSSSSSTRYSVAQIKEEIIQGLHKLLEPRTITAIDGTTTPVPRWEPIKGQTNIVLFMGLYGAGKTTTIMKYAYYYKQRGFNVACICADTFRAGAAAQLKQNCDKVGAYFYYKEYCAPEVVVQLGLQKMLENYKGGVLQRPPDLILVDTAGRHGDEELKRELMEIFKAANQHHTLLVVDSKYGEAAKKSMDFFSNFYVDGIVLTKYDVFKQTREISSSAANQNGTICGEATNRVGAGGFALYATTKTKAPILWVGTGEHKEHLAPFDSASYISRLIGQGDVKKLMAKIQEYDSKTNSNGSGGKVEQLTKKLIAGKSDFTIRDYYEQLEFIIGLTDGDMGELLSSLPRELQDLFLRGLTMSSGDSSRIKKSKGKNKSMEGKGGGGRGGSEDSPPLDEINEKFQQLHKTLSIIVDSMNATELNSTDSIILNPNSVEAQQRLFRISRGCGLPPEKIREALKSYQDFKKLPRNFARGKGGNGGGSNSNGNNSNSITSMINGLASQMGGIGGNATTRGIKTSRKLNKRLASMGISTNTNNNNNNNNNNNSDANGADASDASVANDLLKSLMGSKMGRNINASMGMLRKMGKI